MPCFFIYVHRVSLQSLSPLIIVFLAFSHEIILVSLYLGPLVNNFLNFFFFFFFFFYFFFFLKPEPAQLPGGKIVLSKTLTSRLQTNLLN